MQEVEQTTCLRHSRTNKSMQNILRDRPAGPEEGDRNPCIRDGVVCKSTHIISNVRAWIIFDIIPMKALHYSGIRLFFSNHIEAKTAALTPRLVINGPLE